MRCYCFSVCTINRKCFFYTAGWPDHNQHRTSTLKSTRSVWNSKSSPLLARPPDRTSTCLTARSVSNSILFAWVSNVYLYLLFKRIGYFRFPLLAMQLNFRFPLLAMISLSRSMNNCLSIDVAIDRSNVPWVLISLLQSIQNCLCNHDRLAIISLNPWFSSFSSHFSKWPEVHYFN